MTPTQLPPIPRPIRVQVTTETLALGLPVSVYEPCAGAILVDVSVLSTADGWFRHVFTWQLPEESEPL